MPLCFYKWNLFIYLYYIPNTLISLGENIVGRKEDVCHVAIPLKVSSM